MLIKKVLCLTILMFALVACASDNNSVVEAEKEGRFNTYDEMLHITTDKETGCKYLIFNNYMSNTGGITPLLNKDGVADCN